jgi:hypothetical protein
LVFYLQKDLFPTKPFLVFPDIHKNSTFLGDKIMSEKNKDTPDVVEALATFQERLIAGLIDYGIIIAFVIIGIILRYTIRLIPLIGWWLSWLLSIVFYFAGLAAWFYIYVWMPLKNDGQSFGKKQQNIKIMFVEDEAKWTLRPVNEEEDLVQLLIRAIIGGIEAGFLIPVLIPWYFITNDNNSQRLADQIAKTVIVQVSEKTGKPLKKQRK